MSTNNRRPRVFFTDRKCRKVAHPARYKISWCWRYRNAPTGVETSPICSLMEFMPVLAIHTNNVLKMKMLTVLFIVLLSSSASCQAQDTSINSHCDNSTVEEVWGPEFASEAKLFLAEIQRVVKANDQKAFAALVQYPVHIHRGSSREEIATPAKFLQNYSTIVTPDLRIVILNQSAECLFANGQGVMIGRGKIWFQKQSIHGKCKIIVFNLD